MQKHFSWLFAAITATASSAQPGNPKPPLVLVTDLSWEVSGQQTRFGEYPLSAELVAPPGAPLYGGTFKAVLAQTNGRGQVVPGTMPIWRNPTASSEGESFQFRRAVPLGADPVRKVTLEINCDDVARVYINQRLASAEKRDGKLKDGYDDWFLFRSVSGFMYNRIYTYDVTDYFFTNVLNNILIEACSLAFDGSHAYISAKIVIEFDPIPAPAPLKKKSAPPKRPTATVSKPKELPPAAPEQVLFEAGHELQAGQLQVGSILELGQVYFKADDYHLDTVSFRTLDALAALVKRNPGLKIEIGGHTNLRPNEAFAASLSSKRAYAVMRYLTDHGVPEAQVTHKGYGKSRPRVQAISKDADRANQRVEVKVLEK